MIPESAPFASCVFRRGVGPLLGLYFHRFYLLFCLAASSSGSSSAFQKKKKKRPEDDKSAQVSGCFWCDRRGGGGEYTVRVLFIEA